MPHKMKVLGLALIAVFALSVVAAPSAFGAEGSITPGAFPASLTGSQIGKNTFSVGSAEARVVQCSTASFVTTAALSAVTSTANVKPSYSGCTTSPGGGPATISVGSCTYSLTATTKTNAMSGTGSAAIACSASGLSIRIESPAGSKACEYEISAQTMTGSYIWKSNASDVELTNSLRFSAKVLFGTLAFCGASPGNTVSWVLAGSTTLSADVGGVATSLSIS